MEIKFTEQQLKNLAVFLSRVQTRGIQEAAALVDLAEVINKPIEGLIKPTKEDANTSGDIKTKVSK